MKKTKKKEKQIQKLIKSKKTKKIYKKKLKKIYQLPVNCYFTVYI